MADRKHTSARINREALIVAIIAAGAAILGTLGGGVATYLGNASVTERQLRAERAARRFAAVGVARVMAEDFVTSAALLESMVDQHRFFRSRNRVRTSPAVADKELMAAHLPTTQWRDVGFADTGLVFAERLILQHRGEHFERGHGAELSGWADAARVAANALQPLSGYQPTPAR
jgi:hypothetical protein